MDISQENDVNKLKALAFDTLQRIEIEQQNLGVIQRRIAEVQQAEQEEAEKPKTPNAKKK